MVKFFFIFERFAVTSSKLQKFSMCKFPQLGHNNAVWFANLL